LGVSVPSRNPRPQMPVVGAPDNLYVGREYNRTDGELRQMLRSASEAKFDFVVIPLFTQPSPEEVESQACGSYEVRPSFGSDWVLDSKTWGSAVVGTLSTHVAPDKVWMFREALEKELHWALHLGVYGIILQPPEPQTCELYASALSRLLLGGVYATQMMVRVPLFIDTESGQVDGWDVWNKFRLLCDQVTRLQVALELTEDLPSTEMELDRWLAEPVRAIIVPADIFVTNNQGFPVLSKRHKAFLLKFFRYRVQVILQGIDSDSGDEATSRFVHYIARLFQSKPPLSPQEQFELPYHDYLQAPLQPLQDNLEAQTYETFEKDPVKYVQYEAAICRALQHKQKHNQGQAPYTIIVVGAGRGPLVVAARDAAAKAGIEVLVWAVEKNPNAIITLRHRKQVEDWSNVEIVGEDMRFWQAPRKGDIVVSELLGSFSDNELSPECLDGAQRFLAPDGICIPHRYTSYLTPVTTPKLWNDVKDYNDLSRFETAYVVKLHQAFYPCSEVKPCFTFEHPNWELNSNDRYRDIDFTAQVNALVHGFAGYFHCELFEDLYVSIAPQTYSEGMFSWFPIYFPLRTPVNIKAGQRLRSHWWRCHNDKKVWYEWAVSEPVPLPIHNPTGRSYYIGK